jgi:hypothetical protein
MEQVNDFEDFFQIVSKIQKIAREAQSKHVLRLEVLLLHNFMKLNYNHLIKHKVYHDTFCSSHTKFIKNIPSLVIYSTFLNLGANLSYNNYHNLYISLQTTTNYATQIKIIFELINICPFTIYFIDNPTKSMMEETIKSFANRVDSKFTATMEYLEYTRSLYNFEKVINVPIYDSVYSLYKLYDYKTKEYKHILTNKKINDLATQLYTESRIDDKGYIYQVDKNSYFTYISYIVSNEVCVGLLEQMEYKHIE